MRVLLLAALVGLAGCDTEGRAPGYTGPDDYAYTLTVSCFCLYAGPVRVTVEDGEVVRARALADIEVSQEVIDRTALTLDDLSAIAARAEREADEVSVQYDATYGYPTRLDIDWIAEVADDEISYTAVDFASR